MRFILLTPVETKMSAIDKDAKSKVSKPTDKKFLLGFKDGFLSNNFPLFLAILKDEERRKKKK